MWSFGTMTGDAGAEVDVDASERPSWSSSCDEPGFKPGGVDTGMTVPFAASVSLTTGNGAGTSAGAALGGTGRIPSSVGSRLTAS